MKQYVKAIQFPSQMIHHNFKTFIIKRERRTKKSYGVSRIRVLTKDLFIKKYQLIRRFLIEDFQFTSLQAEVILKMLRYWAYYGAAYFKAKQIYEGTCSKPTFWRIIKALEREHLIKVINRYVLREKAQISNEYIFDKLLLGIARFLSEHFCEIKEEVIQKALELPGKIFWKVFGMLFDFDYMIDFLNSERRRDEYSLFFT